MTNQGIPLLHKALFVIGNLLQLLSPIYLSCVKFVDVKNDVAFPKIFGNENRKEVLISFLNAVLPLNENKQVTDVEILTPY